MATVAGHLIKIKKDHPEANLSYYKPKAQIVKQVEGIYNKMDKSDSISIKYIYDSLKGQVTYDNIKLSLAFID